MVIDDDAFPPMRYRHRLDRMPRLVCLPCGRALFVPISRPFDRIPNQECEICAAPADASHASVFRNYAEMFFSRR